jgi:hypothetical protein
MPPKLKPSPSPIPLPPPRMSKHEKLVRFGAIIRREIPRFGLFSKPNHFVIFHNLEYMTDGQLAATYDPRSAFDLAGMDPALQKAGLRQDIQGRCVSALEAKRFFELSKDELHEFSCDCGGAISNSEMAGRIESIAARS